MTSRYLGMQFALMLINEVKNTYCVKLKLFKSLLGWQGGWSPCATQVRQMGCTGVEARMPLNGTQAREMAQSLQQQVLQCISVAPRLGPDGCTQLQPLTKRPMADLWNLNLSMALAQRRHVARWVANARSPHEHIRSTRPSTPFSSPHFPFSTLRSFHHVQAIHHRT